MGGYSYQNELRRQLRLDIKSHLQSRIAREHLAHFDHSFILFDAMSFLYARLERGLAVMVHSLYAELLDLCSQYKLVILFIDGWERWQKTRAGSTPVSTVQSLLHACLTVAS